MISTTHLFQKGTHTGGNQWLYSSQLGFLTPHYDNQVHFKAAFFNHGADFWCQLFLQRRFAAADNSLEKIVGDSFENAQWRKVKQMQPMWLCILSGRRFVEAFENTQWRKVKQMQQMWLCIFLCKRIEDTFRMHSGKKSNKCNQCNYACSDTRALRTHLKTHSGEKPNKCNQCNYASSRVRNLRRHLKKHTGEKSNK